MDDREWVRADEARQILKFQFSPLMAARRICERAYAGMIHGRAELLQVGQISAENSEIPKEFWWAKGHEALDQDWKAGDFATWIKDTEWKAFGVQFLRADIERLLPHGETSKSDAVTLTDEDKKVVKRLESVVPTAALSYEQATRDLADDTRVSFRGPALELREALREVLDHVAPDQDVMAAPGYVPEKDANGKDRERPTMRQKVRFVMKRKQSSNEATEQALTAFGEAIASLTRAVYNLSSKATHTAGERQAVVQIRRYVVAIIHDILEE